MTPYRPENLDAARPDLVVVGNVIRRVNPEATAVRERRLPAMSFPAAFGSLFLRGRHSVVVAGTHGKTTTSALVAHLLVTAGLDPVVPRRWASPGTTGPTSGSDRATTSWSRATSTTPPTSTRAPSSSTTSRARRSSPAWSWTTPTSTGTRRTTSRRSPASWPCSRRTGCSRSAPPGPPPWRSPRLAEPGGHLRRRPAPPRRRAGAWHPPRARRRPLPARRARPRRRGDIHLAVPGLHNVENALGRLGRRLTAGGERRRPSPRAAGPSAASVAGRRSGAR